MVAHAGACGHNVRASGRPPLQDKWWRSEARPPVRPFGYRTPIPCLLYALTLRCDMGNTTTFRRRGPYSLARGQDRG